MQNLSKKPRVNWRTPSTKSQANVDLQAMQADSKEPDKMIFQSAKEAVNLIHSKGNARLRNGVSTKLSLQNLLGLKIHHHSNGDKLYALQQDSGETKLIEIDQSTFETSEKTAFNGNNSPSATSLGGHFFIVNDSGSVVYDFNPADDTISQLAGVPISPQKITHDGTRLWIAGDGLYFSDATKGITPNFSTGGSDITRSGVANCEIANIVSLISSNRVIIAAGGNRIEGHWTPKIENPSSDTSFPIGVETQKWAVDGFGLESADAWVAVERFVYFKPAGKNMLARLDSADGSIKPLDQISKTIEDLEHTTATMTYDARHELIYYAATKNTRNDTIVCFNIRDNTFSVFPNLFVEFWASNEKNVFFKSSIDDSIKSAFDNEVFNDDGLEIQAKFRTNQTDAGDRNFFKKALKTIFDLRTWAPITAKYQFFADNPVDSSKTADFSHEFQINVKESVDDGVIPTMISPFGLSGVDTANPKATTQKIQHSVPINIPFFKSEIEISFSASSRVDFARNWIYTRKNRKRN